MELKLVNPEDVRSDGQNQCPNISVKNEFAVGEELKDTFDGIYQLAIAALETEGYKSYTFAHPKYGRDVAFFVKDGIVIVADYHGTNVVTAEVLPESEAKLFIESVKDAFGEEEL